MPLINCPECAGTVSDNALVQLRKLTRSVFGKLVKWSFIGFNLLMVLWFAASMNNASEQVMSAGSEIEQAGAAIGTGIGAIIILSIWGFGAVVLGLLAILTRPKG